MKTHLLLIGVLAVAFGASAQKSADENIEISDYGDGDIVNVIVGDKGEAGNVQMEFVENAPKRLNEHGLPRFAIVGNESKFYLGIGLSLKGEAVFDMGDEMPSSFNFTPSAIVPKTPGNGSNLRFTAQTSSIVMNVVALPGTENRIGLFFSASLHDGDGYGFHLGHIYAKYRGFTMGYTNSIFSDDEAMPMTIDNEGPNGSASFKTFTAYYTSKLGKSDNWSAAIGIDAPSVNYTTGLSTSTVNQRIPAVPVYLQYAWNSDSHLRLSGLLRGMQYRDLEQNKNRGLFTWGVQLSGLAAVLPQLSFYWDAVYGKGIGDYLQDDTDLNLDALPCTQKIGTLSNTGSLGVTGGLRVKPSAKTQINAMYSHLTNFRADHTMLPDADAYRYGDYVTANFIYSVNKIVSTGIEWNYGHRKGFSGESTHVNRLQAQLAVSF